MMRLALVGAFLAAPVAAQTAVTCNVGERYRSHSGSAEPMDVRDVVHMLHRIAGKGGSNMLVEQCGDFDASGSLDVADAAGLLGHIVGMKAVAPHHVALLWADEFHPTSSWKTKWWPQTVGPNNGGWYNDEQQRYVASPENVFLSGGALTIRATKTNGTYHSGRLNSKFKFTYGRVDVRAKLPASRGTWPAIWTLGANINELGTYFQTLGYGTTPWAQCGEMDIMEQGGFPGDKAETSSAVHYNPAPNNVYQTNKIAVAGTATEFHVYSLRWTEDAIQTFVDDSPVFASPIPNDFDHDEFKHDHFILLNVAMGGTMGGSIPDDFAEDSMTIDYVRVYM
jgi:beta-glucanase (GH16 family)